MNIRDLEYLIALADFKHFRKAADACNVSQPTLSGQIRKLEDELGTILLERTSRKVLFTQAGLTLVEQAKSVLREVRMLKEMASNQGKEMSGPILIGVIPTLGPYISPIILPELKKQFPELDIYIYEVPTSSLIEQLESGQLDCGIVALNRESEPFIQVRLFTEKMCLAVPNSHEWATRTQKLDLAMLRDKELLMLDNGHCLHMQSMDYCVSVGAKENPRVKASSLETLRNMVSAEVGIALIPALATKLNSSAVTYCEFSEPEPYRMIGLIYRPGSPLRQRYERLAKEIKTIMDGKV